MISSDCIACVLKTGGEFTADHVRLLKDQVQYWMPDYPFVCLSDDESVADVTLRHDWPGWWSKMELFRDDLFRGRVLYMDLDTVIVGDPSEIAVYGGQMCVLRDFYRPNGYGSGMMAWRGQHWIYERFAADAKRYMARYRRGGDQAFLENIVAGPDRFQDLYPGQISSFKPRHSGDRLLELPDNVRVVCFHGRPRPWDVRNVGWIDDVYSGRLAA